MEKIKAVFVGTGMIGAGLAANAACHDFDVTLYDVVDTEQIYKNFEKVLSLLVDASVITKEKKTEILENTTYSNHLEEAVSNVDFIQECVPERLELKGDIYKKIQTVTGNAAIIASSTSAIYPSKLQQGALYPECIVVGHPYNPSYLLPLVEVCGGELVPEHILNRVCEIYTAMGKVPVICRKERPGFIVNQLSWGAMEAAQTCVKEGICSVEDVDKAIMYGPGMRMAVTGQLLTISLGIDGGFRAAAQKYGKEPSEDDILYTDGVDAEIANRPVEKGNTVETVCKYRDQMLADILRLHGLL